MVSDGYSEEDVRYIWRSRTKANKGPVEFSQDMRLSQFDLVACPGHNSSTTYPRGKGKQCINTYICLIYILEARKN